MESSEKYMRERIATKAGQFGRRATDADTRKHLSAMVQKHGEGVLTPVERRVLDRLEGAGT